MSETSVKEEGVAQEPPMPSSNSSTTGGGGSTGDKLILPRSCVKRIMKLNGMIHKLLF